MDMLRPFLCLSCILTLVLAQKINQLRVPDIVNLKTANSVILDCDYDLDSYEGLTVKWFFEDSPVYQWIPKSGRPPQATGILRDRLDLNYKATNQEYSMHRALNIKNLSLNLTGEYRCVVSTWKDEDSQMKKMIILEPPEEVKIYQFKEDDDSVTVVCSAQEMYPPPILNISYEGSAANEILENTSVNKSKTDEGLYNVTTSITLRDDTLEYPTDFICNLHIPDTPYTQQVKLKYYPGNEWTTEPHLNPAFHNRHNYSRDANNLHYTDNAASINTSFSIWISILISYFLSTLFT